MQFVRCVSLSRMTIRILIIIDDDVSLIDAQQLVFKLLREALRERVLIAPQPQYIFCLYTRLWNFPLAAQQGGRGWGKILPPL